MDRKPDFSDLAKKLNLSGLVDNVKSLISPGSDVPNPEEGDALGNQLAALSLLVKTLVQVEEEQIKRLNELNRGFLALFNQLKAQQEAQALKSAPGEASKPASSAPPTSDAENPKGK